MTAEVAILNKSAVALAADSAVTISTRRGGGQGISKIYVNANKLFELIKGAPVGVMIYSSAELGGVPWETLIKAYRHERTGQRFQSLIEYADDFLEFVNDTLDADSYDAESDTIFEVTQDLFEKLYASSAPGLERVRKKVDRRSRLSTALDDLIGKIDNLPLLSWADGVDESSFLSMWEPRVADWIPQQTELVALTAELRRKIATFVLRFMLRTEGTRGPWSGIVISGFGTKDLFPRLYHTSVAGVVDRRLVRHGVEVDEVDRQRPSIIRPYAQTGEATMFLQGMDPAIARALEGFWGTWAKQLDETVTVLAKKHCPGASANEVDALGRAFSDYSNETWKQFQEFLRSELHAPRFDSIEASAGFLSKGEIAELAENLVDLASLRNRVSLDRAETVGGVTDVAVISKGDGFVWVKRKHYFERDRNPAWATQQALGDVVSALQGMSDSEGVTS